jgi:spore coat polysaccharide biosynthesis protein SpsF (cytidylyltransferase family)
LDEPEDYLFLCAVAEKLGNDLFSMADVLDLLDKNPEITQINSTFARNEGLAKSMRDQEEIAD